MHILKFTMLCCIAMLLVVGCASEKKVEQTAEMQQPATPKADSTAKTDISEATPVTHEQITLAVDGMT